MKSFKPTMRTGIVALGALVALPTLLGGPLAAQADSPRHNSDHHETTVTDATRRAIEAQRVADAKRKADDDRNQRDGTHHSTAGDNDHKGNMSSQKGNSTWGHNRGNRGNSNWGHNQGNNKGNSAWGHNRGNKGNSTWGHNQGNSAWGHNRGNKGNSTWTDNRNNRGYNNSANVVGTVIDSQNQVDTLRIRDSNGHIYTIHTTSAHYFFVGNRVKVTNGRVSRY